MHAFFGFPAKNLSYLSQPVTRHPKKPAMTGKNGSARRITRRAEPVTNLSQPVTRISGTRRGAGRHRRPPKRQTRTCNHESVLTLRTSNTNKDKDGCHGELSAAEPQPKQRNSWNTNDTNYTNDANERALSVIPAKLLLDCDREAGIHFRKKSYANAFTKITTEIYHFEIE